jgi:phytoene dehydrogenase-like protein
MGSTYDAIVVGGGHNGLVHAAYLARAGWKVLVCERRSLVGGAAVTEEVVPGYRFSVASYVVSLLRPEIIRDLGLHGHGLELLPLAGTFTPLTDADFLWRPGDPAGNRREIARHSAADADAYPEFGRVMSRMARAVQPLLDMTPPDPGHPGIRDLGSLVTLAGHLRGLDPHDRYALMRLMTMSSLDLVDEWFETDALRATLAASGVIGTFLGIHSPGTAYVLLHHYMGEVDGVVRAWGLPRGGTGAVSNAIRSAAEAAGAEIRTGSPVFEICVRDGRATGVRLESGEVIPSRVVSSGVDPRLTFLKMVGPDQLPEEFVHAVERYRFRGSSAKVNLALDGLPEFTALRGSGAHLKGAISISPGVNYMQRAYEDAVRGGFSRRPYLDIVIPSLLDPSLAPPGRHVMSCFVQYAPYHLRSGTWDEQRDQLGQTVLDTIAEHAPNIRDVLVGMQVLTPLDLERVFGLSEGNIFHGEMSLEQMFFMRPVPGWARYRTPIRDLYVCGSGSHPGGGIMGAPGRNAAREVLRDHRV